MRRLLYILLLLFFLVRHDVWFWNDGRLVVGLPAGLVFHAGYCLAAAGLMALLVRHAWPVADDER